MSQKNQTDVQPNGRALDLYQDPLLNQIFNEFEQSAFDRFVNSKPEQTEEHRDARVRVLVIRSLRDRLAALAKGKAKRERGNAVP